jgi:DNA-binding transcriptional MerR regulator
VLTIGRLAHYVGVSTKTIRVYHDKGLLAEPGRDASGYRRYTARDAIALIKIRTLAQAGVPLARIRDLMQAAPEDFDRTLHQVDLDLTTRIRQLRETQRRLRRLDASHLQLLPPDIAEHLEALPGLGFSERWVDMETDLWILLCATHPDMAIPLFRDQAQAQTDPDLRQIFLDYDHAHDLDPADPAIDELARRMVTATKDRYRSGELPGQDPASDIPALVQGAINASSPAWRRIDTLIRQELLPDT